VLQNSDRVPFRDVIDRDEHFDAHRLEFGVNTPEEYEAMADQFLFGPMNIDVHQCVRLNDTTVRLNYVNLYLGVGNANRGIVWTFHVVEQSKIVRAGSPQQYLQEQCRRNY
jgi:hypothetical protein